MTSQITIVGNLTRDPEMRFTPSGMATVAFGVAVNRRWKQADEWKEQTSFFDVVAWRDLADNIAESLTKGARVIVTGRLEQRTWEDNDGQRRSKVEIVADDIGPSLRWATAEVRRTERRGPDQGGYQPAGGHGQAYDDPEAPFLYAHAAYDVSGWA